MEIGLDTTAIEPGGILRGHVSNVPPAGITLAVRCHLSNPYNEHDRVVASHAVGDGPFELPGPTWPLTADGPVLQAAWSVDVVAATGAIAASVPFRVVRDEVVIRSLDDADRADAARHLPRQLVAVTLVPSVLLMVGAVFAFLSDATLLGIVLAVVAASAIAMLVLTSGGGRPSDDEHHHLRCTVTPADGGLVCRAEIPPTSPPLAGVTSATATLLVVEAVSWLRPGGGHVDREEVVATSTTDLVADGDRAWTGVVLDLPTDTAPLSWSTTDEHEHWSVTWAVRFRIETAHGDEIVQSVHLRAFPAGLDPEIGGATIDDPAALA